MRPPQPYVPSHHGRHQQATATLAGSRPVPLEGECLVCFLRRGVLSDGCRGDHGLVECFREVRAPAATGVAEALLRRGAACDGAVVGGVWRLVREHRQRDVHTDELVVPEPFPSCCGVGPSSARPCALWESGPRRRAGRTWACAVPEKRQTAVL